MTGSIRKSRYEDICFFYTLVKEKLKGHSCQDFTDVKGCQCLPGSSHKRHQRKKNFIKCHLGGLLEKALGNLQNVVGEQQFSGTAGTGGLQDFIDSVYKGLAFLGREGGESISLTSDPPGSFSV